MISRSASTTANLLDELQATLTHGTVARRVETLRRVTDLFLGGAVDYSDEQVALFDDVFKCLIDHIEVSARTLLANRLAQIDNAPRDTIRLLAFDDVIEVAGPVLSKSERLDDEALIEAARSKSQAHLLAISIRRVLSRAVTDVLVQRGNDEVVQSTVNNPGAEFSEGGFDRLVSRAEGDDELATCLGQRPTLPRHLYLKLLAKASAAVRERLQTAHPEHAGNIPSAVREATRRAHATPAAVTKQTEIAHGLVKSLYEDGRLNEQLADAIRGSEQVRRDQCRDRGAGQRAGRNGRDHDDGKSRRGRHDPCESREPVMAYGQDGHHDARRCPRRRPDRSRGLQEHL